MDRITEIMLCIFASTGFWALVQTIYQTHASGKTAEKAALLGLLHNELLEKCEFYLDRGYLSEAEYRDLEDYVYKPYKGLGGNGTGEEYMKRVQGLIFAKKEGKGKE